MRTKNKVGMSKEKNKMEYYSRSAILFVYWSLNKFIETLMTHLIESQAEIFRGIVFVPNIDMGNIQWPAAMPTLDA